MESKINKVTFGWKGTGHRDRKGVNNNKQGRAVKHDEGGGGDDDDGGGWALCLAAHNIPVHLTLNPAGHWTARCHTLGLYRVPSHRQVLPSTLFQALGKKLFILGLHFSA